MGTDQWDLVLRKLHVFCAIVDCGGVNAAADHLGIAQPSVTAHLRALETHLDSTLFMRSRGRRNVITATGQALYKYACETLTKSLEFQAAVKRFDPAAAQTVSIVIQQALANYITPAALATFLRDRPDARISIYSEPLSQTIKLMREGRVDAAIAMASPETNEFEGVIIGATPLLIIASPQHPLAKNKRIAVSDLEHYDLVAGMQGSAGWGMLNSILNESGLRKPRIVLRMQSVVSVINAVIHDIGLACTHACAARQEIADGKLVVIETDPPLPPVPIKLMIHEKAMCRELIEALTSTLIEGADL
jgi:DNA-binding transcriptional LysR family regulator